MASSSLTLLAGPAALTLLRERSLRAEDVDVVPGASGGPKWLVLSGLDRMLFGELLQAPRTRPLHLIGSSIGSWRLACLAQKDPVAALDRFEAAYVEQRYPPKPSPALVTETSARILEQLLGPSGAEELLAHPWARLHVVTTRCRGPLASERRAVQLAGLALAAAGNLLTRKSLPLQMQRVVFHTAGDQSPFAGLRDLPTVHLPLTAANLRPALLASGSIPLVLAGVRVPGAPPGTYRDGGVVDYHLDLHYGAGEGLVLYPHFYPYVVPGWFDKSLRWRRASAANFARALILAPSAEFVARLPGGKIPDRDDFVRLSDAERLRAWRTVRAESERLGDELRELLAKGRLADAVRPL
ncbi:patatin-like phospholipase family protein [Aggregicoccus sp. 17bor-14]|uniref:patatin-like phospholipase family protein n=1 Tax=Myxococcaceae TaxID=31 RepID=UPI00129CDA34|nr:MULTISPECIES: patatin-like phospholipase family protein [Myxococcaceae]MBF5043225.1 patatin-like phospholipase family protein [Simulacricoccus sp. 17bor-14]MRI88982.1 patatin-like phospholipase family protein [Aggregicoccus sp. 17bor-14]